MNDGYIYRELIDRRAAGQELHRYLSARYLHSSPAQWTEHLLAGRVLLDGVAAAAGAVLSLGQKLEYHRPAWEEPDAPLDLPVLHEGDGVIVVGKPSGLPTLPGGGFLQHTLLHQLRLLHPDASPMHRLGRWTSGAVLCSRNSAAGADIAAQFAARAVDKRYRALASGRPEQDAFSIDVPIGPVPYPPLGTLHAALMDGKRASSSVTVLEHRAGAFLCDVRIATGRPHQIRIHLAAVGHPLVGDPLYVGGGQPREGGTALPGDPGYLLHAAEIGFSSPGSRLRIVVQAPPPEALRVGAAGAADGAG